LTSLVYSNRECAVAICSAHFNVAEHKLGLAVGLDVLVLRLKTSASGTRLDINLAAGLAQTGDE
jgi:hypothetical protein